MGGLAIIVIVILVIGYIGYNWDPNRPVDPDDDLFL